jgi:hypothetical protein
MSIRVIRKTVMARTTIRISTLRSGKTQTIVCSPPSSPPRCAPCLHAHGGPALAAASPLDDVELLEVVFDRYLAHAVAGWVFGGILLSQIGSIPSSDGHY